MKTIKRLFLLAFVVTAVAAGWLRSSPYWTILEIQQGIAANDVDRVERVVAFERFASSSTAAAGTMVADQLGVAGSDPGSGLVGALVGAVAQGVGAATAKEAATGLRRAISEGRLERRVGALEVAEGLDAFGPFTTTIDGAFVTIKGTCNDSPASIVLEMERRDDGPFGGYPRRFVIVGIEPQSARALARQCAAAPTSTR